MAQYRGAFYEIEKDIPHDEFYHLNFYNRMLEWRKHFPILAEENIAHLENQITALDQAVNSLASNELVQKITDIKTTLKTYDAFFTPGLIDVNKLATDTNLYRIRLELPTVIENAQNLTDNLNNIKECMALENVFKDDPQYKAFFEDINQGNELEAINFADYLETKNEAKNEIYRTIDLVNETEANGINLGNVAEETKAVTRDLIDDYTMTENVINDIDTLRNNEFKTTLSLLKDLAINGAQSVTLGTASFVSSNIKNAQTALAMAYSESKQVFSAIKEAAALNTEKFVRAFDTILDRVYVGAWSSINKGIDEKAKNIENYLNEMKAHPEWPKIEQKFKLSDKLCHTVAVCRNRIIKKDTLNEDKEYWNDVKKGTYDYYVQAGNDLKETLNDVVIKPFDEVSETIDKIFAAEDTISDKAKELQSKLICAVQKADELSLKFTSKFLTISATLCHKLENRIDIKIDELKASDKRVYDEQTRIEEKFKEINEKLATPTARKEYVPSEELKKSIQILSEVSPARTGSLSYKRALADVALLQTKEKLVNSGENLKNIFKDTLAKTPLVTQSWYLKHYVGPLPKFFGHDTHDVINKEISAFDGAKKILEKLSDKFEKGAEKVSPDMNRENDMDKDFDDAEMA